MAFTDSIKWHIDEIDYELIRNTECKEILIFQRGDNLPHFFSVQEASMLCLQMRRILNRSEFYLASKRWADSNKGSK